MFRTGGIVGEVVGSLDRRSDPIIGSGGDRSGGSPDDPRVSAHSVIEIEVEKPAGPSGQVNRSCGQFDADDEISFGIDNFLAHQFFVVAYQDTQITLVWRESVKHCIIPFVVNRHGQPAAGIHLLSAGKGHLFLLEGQDCSEAGKVGNP